MNKASPVGPRQNSPDRTRAEDSVVGHYSNALRCIGQALEKKQIEVFELKLKDGFFRLQCGDPEPPYLKLIELNYSFDDLLVLERKARAERGGSSERSSFDSLAELLRALGRHVDKQRAWLLRICNAELSTTNMFKLEYMTRNRDVKSQEIGPDFLYEHCVRMYKERDKH